MLQPFVLVIITVLFMGIAFLSNALPTAGNAFVQFAIIIWQALTFYPLLTIIGFILLAALAVKPKQLLETPIRVVVSAVAAFFLAFFALLFIAILQLDVSAILASFAPQTLGIETDRTKIIKTLQSVQTPPEIIASDKDPNKEVLAIATATAGKTNFYGKTIVGAIPEFLFLPVAKQNSSLSLIGDTLIITQINQDDLQTISPLIGYTFLKNYFTNRPIRSYPKISIMTREEYAIYRQKEARKQVASLAVQIVKLQDSISSLSATIEQDQLATAAAKTNADQGLTQAKNDYSTCLKSQKEKATCKDILTKYNTAYDQRNKDVASKNNDIEKNQNLLKTYQQYLALYKQQKNAVKNSGITIQHELGVFEPNNSIKIALDTENPHAIADYFETVTHEYLHYASYVSKEKHFNDLFFEEGLTEYFARQTIDKDLQIDTNLGYPMYVKIIDEMTKIIPESELADYYFSKDEQGLESALNRVYGDDFYQKNQVIFSAFQYTTNPKQVLQLANILMKQIGGYPLTEKDLNSSISNL